jgi:hypothetical protein
MRTKLPVVWIMAGHLAIGVGLGTLLALLLIANNSAHVLDIIERASEPSALLTVLICGFASTFGIGATITGFIFTQLERRQGN